MVKNADLFQNEQDYPDLNSGKAVEHLRQAIRFRTVSFFDASETDYREFDALHKFLKSSFPLIGRTAAWKTLGHSLLITVPGRNAALKPALFMAHQDVVPVVPSSEGKWVHEPFSGDLSEGYIWGRGAMDIKQMLTGEMEALEFCLSKGTLPERSVILAFGEDEETHSTGARALVTELEKRGVELEYVLDEGAGDVSDAGDWGAPGTLICTIGMYEKGYADLELTAQSPGGHSSNPFRGTSLGKLSEAITEILRNPSPAELSESVLRSLKELRPYISEEPMKTWAKAPDTYERELLDWFGRHESLYHLVQTTAAPTMITPGSPAGNVMPQDMRAVVNFRLTPADPPEKLIKYLRTKISPEVSLRWEQQIGASRPSDFSSMGFLELREVLKHYFDRLVFIPAQNRGATDARWYEKICRCVMRFGPFLEEEKVSREGIHGTNERISVRAYLQGIRVLIRMMEVTCFCSGEKEVLPETNF